MKNHNYIHFLFQTIEFIARYNSKTLEMQIKLSENFILSHIETNTRRDPFKVHSS